ncbi:hypothetical protein LPE509_02009 [Legionella pneumophila subsp. pneumophila LPE509]|nr:hypothetical protein LPE509_02009 [Legionella pneumophila subsp. pneumophila LPE509]
MIRKIRLLKSCIFYPCYLIVHQGGANQDMLLIAVSHLKKDVDTGKIECTKLKP